MRVLRESLAGAHLLLILSARCLQFVPARRIALTYNDAESGARGPSAAKKVAGA